MSWIWAGPAKPSSPHPPSGASAMGFWLIVVGVVVLVVGMFIGIGLDRV